MITPTQSGAEIPVTPAMIAAAERVWYEGVRRYIGTGMLTAIYRAMRAAEESHDNPSTV
jgi:hypothetical protein